MEAVGKTNYRAEFTAFRKRNPLRQPSGIIGHQRMAEAEGDSPLIDNFWALPHDPI